MTKRTKIIFYFHGYASSANTDKVSRLKAVPNSEVYAYDIDIDPSASIPFLTSKISEVVHKNYNEQNCDIVFVGTSLGGWYANELSKIFGTKSILVNPCYDPCNSLLKYNVSESILNKYHRMEISDRSSVIIAEDDEVIDFSGFDYDCDVTFVESGGHRFNGKEFEEYVVGHSYLI